MKICIDPGHGNWNAVRGRYDSGAVAGGAEEASIAMDWANTLREFLRRMGHSVVRTRVDRDDPAPVSRRDDIAKAYGCERMISLHCNSSGGQASGTEVFYRGEDDRALASKLSHVVSDVLRIPDRGAKTERQSQHKSLAVMEFDKCWLLEIGFIDHPIDRARMLDASYREAACQAIATLITS